LSSGKPHGGFEVLEVLVSQHATNGSVTAFGFLGAAVAAVNLPDNDQVNLALQWVVGCLSLLHGNLAEGNFALGRGKNRPPRIGRQGGFAAKPPKIVERSAMLATYISRTT
jgi:hypothetical protein